MKKIILTLFLLLTFNLPVFAANHPINVFNDTNKNIAYVMMSNSSTESIDELMPHSVRLYFPSMLNGENIAVVATICNMEPGEKNHCASYNEFTQCTDGYYDSNLISAIHIKSATSCMVTCVDGSATSCKR